MSDTTGGSSGADDSSVTTRSFDLGNADQVVLLLRTIHRSPLDSGSKNEIRDAIFRYQTTDTPLTNEIVSQLKGLGVELSMSPNEAPAISNQTSTDESSQTSSDTIAQSPKRPQTGRPVPRFSAPKAAEPVVPTSPSQPVSEDTTAPATSEQAQSSEPDVTPAKTPAVPKAKDNTLVPPTSAPTENDPPAAASAPAQVESVPATAPEPSSNEAALSRISAIKRDVNSLVANPVNLIDADNTIGREYMDALLGAMKQVSGGGTKSETEAAMHRLEAAYQAVKKLLARMTSTKPAPKPKGETEATPTTTDGASSKEPETPEEVTTAPAPVEVQTTAVEQASAATENQESVADQLPPTEQSTDTSAPVETEYKIPVTPVTCDKAPDSVTDNVPVPATPTPAVEDLADEVDQKDEAAARWSSEETTDSTKEAAAPEPAEPTEPVETTPQPTAVSSVANAASISQATPETPAEPTSRNSVPTANNGSVTASSISIPTPVGKERQLKDLMKEQAEAAKTVEQREAEKAKQNPLMANDVTNGLKQLLSEWKLFKSSGLFGTGPNGIEHPLYQELANLTMAAVMAGRYESATSDIKQSITDYMNGWRYEEGVVHEHGETFEHYLRRVIRHILDRNQSSTTNPQ